MGAVQSIRRLEVPIIVRLGERTMKLHDVLGLTPGSIIELPQHAGDELALLVNNKAVGLGQAVKVGENFGLKITFVGDVLARLEASVAGSLELNGGEESSSTDEDAAAVPACG